MGKLVILSLIAPPGRPQSNHDLSTIVKSLDDKCRSCAPISPLQCIDRCEAYKLKSELRALRKAMANPNYTRDLFNVLKNETRFRMMQTIVNGKYSVSQLQQELKKAGHRHSQDNICREYLTPLVAVGLAAQVQDMYYATHFGDRLTPLLTRFPDFAEQMPANSEGYEEMVLQSMLTGPKTFEDIEALVPPKVVSRVLKRLRNARLVRTPKERDYVFFYKSKRDPDKEAFTETERRIYDAIAPQGLPVGALAKKTKLSSRITYRYLRGLRGKKLIFSRKTPKAYRLTCRGIKLAASLSNIEKVIEETWNCSQHFAQDNRLTLEGGGSFSSAQRN